MSLTVNKSNHIALSEFDPDMMVFKEITTGGKDEYIHNKVEIRYNYGTYEDPILDRLILVMPRLSCRNGIKKFQMKNDLGIVNGYNYTYSIYCDPSSNDNIYQIIDSIYNECFKHLIRLQRETGFKVLSEVFMDMIDVNNINGAVDDMGVLPYPIKFQPKYKEGGNKEGKVIEGSPGYLGLKIDIRTWGTSFILPTKSDPVKLDPVQLCDDEKGFAHQSFIQAEKIHLGSRIKCVKFRPLQVFVAGLPEDEIIGEEHYSSFAQENEKGINDLINGYVDQDGTFSNTSNENVTNTESEEGEIIEPENENGIESGRRPLVPIN